MNANDNSTPAAPKPPDDLHDEALLEWHRVSQELRELGLLDAADRAVIAHHCRTWQQIIGAARIVALDGPIVELPNKWLGRSEEAKWWLDLTKFDATLLAQIGLTPAARAKLTPKSEQDDKTDSISF